MAHKKHYRKDAKDNLIETHSPAGGPEPFEREQDQAINKVLDETRREIPHFSPVVQDYQEYTIKVIIEIINNFVESQENVTDYFLRVMSVWTVSPIKVAENYVKLFSSFADNSASGTRVINTTVFENIDSVNTYLQHGNNLKFNI